MFLLRHTACKFRRAFSCRRTCLHDIYFIVANDSNLSTVTVLCNGTYMNIKGHVQIVYDSNTPYIEYKSTNTVNADSVIIHAQKGQIKNNGVSTVTR